jgi:hypothetical protein
MAYCIAKTKAGKDCTAQAMHAAEHCYRHNPNISEADKREASIQGGKATQVLADAEPVTLRRVESIISLIESNINDVRTGKIDPRVSNAVVQNVNALLKVYELAIVDSRVRKLEQQAGIDVPDELIQTGSN